MRTPEMGKLHTVGAFVYLDDDSVEVLDRAFEQAAESLWFEAAKHRLERPAPDQIKVIVHRPSPGSADPYDLIGTVGYKARVPHLPWYRGWIDMLRARWLLRGLR